MRFTPDAKRLLAEQGRKSGEKYNRGYDFSHGSYPSWSSAFFAFRCSRTRCDASFYAPAFCALRAAFGTRAGADRFYFSDSPKSIVFSRMRFSASRLVHKICVLAAKSSIKYHMAAPFPADDSLVSADSRVSRSTPRLQDAAMMEWVSRWGLLA
jgi:hypothetical protein